MLIDEWKQVLIEPAATIRDAAENLSKTGLKISIVVDSDLKLLGTVADGDIRRGLLRGCSLESLASEVMVSAPLVVSKGISKEVVLQLMKSNQLQQLPIINDKGQCIGLHVRDILDGETHNRKNTMVIMAGGKGTRLRPFTEDCPKPMLEVSGKPMLLHIIERARNEGIQRFIISLNYKGHVIKEYFGSGSDFGVQISYVEEDVPLGTGGALSLIEDDIEFPILVSNGDVLTELKYADLLDFHTRHEAVATMAVSLHRLENPFGVVDLSGLNIVGFTEKPVVCSNINAGVYVFERAALSALIPGEHCDVPELFMRLREQRKNIVAYPMHEPWLDVGKPEDLFKARNAD